MANVVPTLDTSGWVSGPAEKAERLMAYFFVSEYSQSEVHAGQIKSLPYLVSMYGREPYALRGEAERALIGILRPYFDDVDASVSVPVEVDPSTNKIDLTVTCTVVQDGKSYSLGRMLTYVNSKLSKVSDLAK